MLHILISNITKILEVILLLNNECNKRNPRKILLKVICATEISLSDIILLSNFIWSSELEVSVETYGNLNLNEAVLLTTCSTDFKLMGKYSTIKMESSLPIVENDLKIVAHLISEYTAYDPEKFLNDVENKRMLTVDEIKEYELADDVCEMKNFIKSNSCWFNCDIGGSDETEDLGPMGPIIPPTPECN